MNFKRTNNGNNTEGDDLSEFKSEEKRFIRTAEFAELELSCQEIKIATNEIVVKLSDEEIENAKNLTMLFHVNVMDDHITVEEVKPGKVSRIFNIYIRQNGNGEFRLWCEHDNSYECWHVKAAWTYPHVQKMMMHYKDKTKPCEHCKTVNDSDASFCKRCGVKLE